MTIKRALISCTDKTGLVDFARFLSSRQIEILSTGGTARLLRDNDIPVTEVSEHTGSPEILDGRVKTLHPKIHGGLLGLRDNSNHQKQMADNAIEPIDLVVVNLYAFEDHIAKDDCSFDEAIENIDIGGPSMLRSAAKNHKFVTVVIDPADYPRIQQEIEKVGSVSDTTRQGLALKVFQSTSAYDSAIASYLDKQFETWKGSEINDGISFHFSKIQDLRYGENSHQQAAFYRRSENGLGGIIQHQGKELSFNNILDTDAAYRVCLEFENPSCVIVKHNNPCGVASHSDIKEAFLRAQAGDPVSSFGGIVALNQTVTAELAEVMAKTFFEVVLAPAYDEAALEVFAKKKNLRILSLNEFFHRSDKDIDIRLVRGGALIQDADLSGENIREAKVVTKRAPTEQEWQDLEFVWKVCKHVKSNAIIFGKNEQILGIGAGQMSRIDSTRIAALKAKESFKNDNILHGSAMASDAFFPFRDGLDAATELGISAVIQPGGSVRDEEVIAAADERDVAMVLTGVRHFRH